MLPKSTNNPAIHLIQNINNKSPGINCYRNCITDINMICYYKFVLEHYHVMGPACGNCANGVISDCNNTGCIVADGIERGVLSINRQIPGPQIHVCKNDLIVVDVVNKAAGTAASIHWHGFHQRETPYMDGVPFVTQCPIPYSTTFRYSFRATEVGTHFYHSHSGHHKINGQYGGIVVREPTNNINSNTITFDYDLPEHLIVISDWMHSYAEMFVPGLPTRHPGIQPDSLLINGRGQYINPLNRIRTTIGPPPHTFHVTAKHRYRFRLVNSASHACPQQFQIEGHNLTIIASDSYNVEPKPFTTLVSNSGERYDFIVDANQSPRNYFIRIRALGTCSSQSIESFAILSYQTESQTDTDTLDDILKPSDYPNYNQTFPNGILLNHPNSSCSEDMINEHCISELRSTDSTDLDLDLRSSVPDHTYYLGFAMHRIANSDIFKSNVDNYQHFSNFGKNVTVVGAINHLSHVFPSFPPLTQSGQLNDIDFCELDQVPDHCKNYQICPCVHRIHVNLNSIIELIVVDETLDKGRVHHPFHLHGFRFMVVGMGQHPQGIPMTIKLAKYLERIRELPRLQFNPNPPFKDTVSIPSRGYAILKLRADNPGFWLMHCHYEWHLATGMGLIVQVGRPDQMIKTPMNFPKCGNYISEISSALSDY